MGEGDGKGREMRVGEGKGEVDGWVRKEIEIEERERDEHVERGCGAQQGGEEDEGRWDLHCECLLIVGGI